jgi:hypothetical protein
MAWEQEQAVVRPRERGGEERADQRHRPKLDHASGLACSILEALPEDDQNGDNRGNSKSKEEDAGQGEAFQDAWERNAEILKLRALTVKVLGDGVAEEIA